MLLLTRIFSIFFLSFFLSCGHAFSSENYLSRFLTWLDWYQHLPKQPDAQFLSMIEEDTPLAKRLRYRWLIHLAEIKNWQAFSEYYRPSQNYDLQCFSVLSDFYLNQTEKILDRAVDLWLSGESRPPACALLFELIIKPSPKSDFLISERLRLAFQTENISLIHYLLDQLSSLKRIEKHQFLEIDKHPERIVALNEGELAGLFYLYGLKKILKTDIHRAILYWQHPKARQILSLNERSLFLREVALQKARKNETDAHHWFSKVSKHLRTTELVEAEIRWLLKRERWSDVIFLIHETFGEPDEPCWQYWLARSFEKIGEKERARIIYENLSGLRHYYGFLSSAKLNKAYSLQNEMISLNPALLKAYQPILNRIQTLYQNRQLFEASRLVNDFVSELPKEEETQIALWLSEKLHWYSKSVAVSNTNAQNYLSLRFPLPFLKNVDELSAAHHTSRALIYAIIRQESAFREDAISSAGARGLMQLMPSTAKFVAKLEHISYHSPSDLLLKDKNMALGVAYLKQLARKFSDNPILMAAAYNAGPGNVLGWLKESHAEDMDLFIETIPWKETRNYLKNVLAFYVVYQHRMNTSDTVTPFLRSFWKSV